MDPFAHLPVDIRPEVFVTVEADGKGHYVRFYRRMSDGTLGTYGEASAAPGELEKVVCRGFLLLEEEASRELRADIESVPRSGWN
jgi:hypothetical protein